MARDVRKVSLTCTELSTLIQLLPPRGWVNTRSEAPTKVRQKGDFIPASHYSPTPHSLPTRHNKKYTDWTASLPSYLSETSYTTSHQLSVNQLPIWTCHNIASPPLMSYKYYAYKPVIVYRVKSNYVINCNNIVDGTFGLYVCTYVRKYTNFLSAAQLCVMETGCDYKFFVGH